MKTIHHGKLFLCFILVACVLATPTAYATGGGSFDVPQIHEDFNQGKPAPAPKPTEELNVAPSKQEKGFFSQVGDFVSGSWNKLKNGVSNTWNNLKNGAKKAWDTAASATKKAAQKAWDWMTSTAGKITGGIVLGITALTGLLSKFGQPLARGIQSAYTSLKNLFARKGLEGQNLTASLGNAGMAGGNSQYPYGKLSDSNITDQQLAYAAQLAYKDEIKPRDIYMNLGNQWQEEKVLYKDHISGLQAHVFKNPETKEIIIAFRGTESDPLTKDTTVIDVAQDLFADIFIANGFDRYNPQAVEARKYVEKIINDPKYKGYNIALTGHSLGGYLASDCGARYKIPTVTFNAAGMNLYDNLNISKGREKTFELIQKVPFVPEFVKSGDHYRANISDPQIREIVENEKVGAYDDLIRNYRYKDDLVGSFGYRPGKTYNILPDGSVELAEDTKGLDNKINLSWGHSISNFTGDDDGKKVDTPIVNLYGEDGNIMPRKKE
jgi:hypothetical protein